MTTEPITALNLPRAEPLPEDIEKYYRVCEEKLGLIPNVLAAYGFSPERLRAFSGMYNQLMLADSGLSKAEREMIAVAVSAENHCFYCLVAHGAALRELTGDAVLADTIGANYRHAGLSTRQKAMLDFAVQVTKASNTIEEADREALRGAGFSNRDIWDIAEVAGFFNMTNRVASATGMRPNADYHGAAR
ncbi:MAG: peroxidase-related enzyme [Paracoccaceae bacterium]